MVLAGSEFCEISGRGMLDGLIDPSRLGLVPAHSLMNSTENNTDRPKHVRYFHICLMFYKISQTYLVHIIHILLPINRIIHMFVIKRISTYMFMI